MVNVRLVIVLEGLELQVEHLVPGPQGRWRHLAQVVWLRAFRAQTAASAHCVPACCLGCCCQAMSLSAQLIFWATTRPGLHVMSCLALGFLVCCPALFQLVHLLEVPSLRAVTLANVNDVDGVQAECFERACRKQALVHEAAAGSSHDAVIRIELARCCGPPLELQLCNCYSVASQCAWWHGSIIEIAADWAIAASCRSLRNHTSGHRLGL